MSLLGRARAYARNHGVGALLRRGPRVLFRLSIRPFLPTRGRHRLNGVPWRTRRLGDSVTTPGWSDPTYEDALLSALRSQVRPGDSVGVIGGGRGISSVVAAERAGTDGRVAVYEASADRIDWIEQTVSLNEVADRVDVHHALVGPAVAVYGRAGSVSHVAPQDLPAFDVLEMDCEGAELAVLRELDQSPRVVIVEVHPPEVTEAAVRDVLDDRGYVIVDRGWENEDAGTPLPILTAVRESAAGPHSAGR